MEDDSRIQQKQPQPQHQHYFTPPTSPVKTQDSSICDWDEEELQSVACASALVGESIVLDSPTQQQRSINTGLLERGLSWWSNTREQNKRELLELQVEEQRRKLRNALNLPQDMDDNYNSNYNYNDDHLNKDGQVSSPHISKSGAGMSVQLSVPPSPQNLYKVVIEDEPTTSHSFCPYLLSQDVLSQIAQRVLPPSVAHSKWKRVYSLARDGDAFDGFLMRVEREPHTLLSIKTTKGDVFGGYTDSPWKHSGTPEFYGSATACLWSLQKDDESNNSNYKVGEVKVYKWTGCNRYIQYLDSQRKLLAFGGGGGAFGLCVEHDFQRGSTGRCETFGNDLLCSEENFDIIDVEVYGFLLGQLSY
jgi:hypothetical protein